MANCRVCNRIIDGERLERWPWAVSCSRRCSDANSADARRRRRDKARAMSQTFNRAEYGRRSTAVRPRPSATVLYSVLGAGERDGQASGGALPSERPAYH